MSAVGGFNATPQAEGRTCTIFVPHTAVSVVSVSACPASCSYRWSTYKSRLEAGCLEVADANVTRLLVAAVLQQYVNLMSLVSDPVDSLRSRDVLTFP
jgi:hypothetical protein